MRTMRSKMLFGIAALMLLTITTLVFFVWHNTNNALGKMQESEAHNLLAFTRLLVETEHQSILFHEQEMLRTRKNELSDILDTAMSSLDLLYQKSRRGEITDRQAQQQALEFLEEVRYDAGIGYIWVNDTTKPIPRMVMHPEIPELNGEILDDPAYNCAYGTDINLFSAFRNVCENEGEGYVDYMWPKPMPDGSIGAEQPKISYVRLFEPWDWVVGTGLYIDDIKASAKYRLDAVEVELKEALSELRINNSGYVYIFNGDHEYIAHPAMPLRDNIEHINPETGNLLIDDLIEAARSDSKNLEYLCNRPGYDNERFIYQKISYLTYFEPLDWYIGASYYLDDVRRDTIALRNQIILISFAFLLLAITVAFFFARHISEPLKQLATDASRISRMGVKGQTVIEAGPLETQELGRVLNTMLTSLHQTEVSLMESREDLRITLNSIGDAVIATDNQGRITRMNPEAEKLTGWSFEMAKDKLIDEVMRLMNQHTREPVAPLSYKVFETRKITQFDEPVLLIDRIGNECAISDSAAPIIDHDDNLLGTVIVFRDITMQLEAERQLQQQRKMDSIGQLAGGIAHDFNNMLSGILGFAELLGMSVKQDPQMMKLIDGITKSAITAAELVNKLLSFAREAPLMHREFDFHECLDDALVLLQRSINRNINVEVMEKARKSIIRGDSAQIENVILNLGLNAADAMPDGGDLKFETDNIYLDKAFCSGSSFEIEEGEYLLVKCIDNGAGIPQKLVEKIFEPYFTTKEIGKGSGLGLAAVFGSVSSHHGAIFVYSEVGKGASFHIYLPIVDGGDESVKEKASTETVKGSGGVLVIDDELLVRTMAQGVLSALGYTVYMASDGLSGLKMYEDQQEDIDVVILDMIMPSMPGNVCFHELRKLNPDVNVIISSGFSKNDSIDKLLSSGARGYIKKPYTMKEISRVLARVLAADN